MAYRFIDRRTFRRRDNRPPTTSPTVMIPYSVASDEVILATTLMEDRMAMTMADIAQGIDRLINFPRRSRKTIVQPRRFGFLSQRNPYYVRAAPPVRPGAYDSTAVSQYSSTTTT